MKIDRLIYMIVCLSFLISVEAQIISSIQTPTDTLEIGQEFDLRFSFYSTEPNLVKEIDLSSIFETKNLIQIDTSQADETIDMEITSYGNWPVNQDKAYPKASDWNKNNKGYSLNYFVKAIIWDWGIFPFEGLDAVVDSNFQLNIAEPKLLFVNLPEEPVLQDTTSMITDIKPILDEPLKAEDFYPIGYALLGFLALFGIYKLINRTKDPDHEVEEVEPEIIRPAHEIAFERLDTLKSKELWQQGEIKAYQSELTFAIREYLENRYGIKALENTTDEMLKSLKTVDFDQSHKDDLKDIMTMADLVKFAKAKPGESIHESFMIKAKDLVNNTKKEIVEDHE